MASVSLVGLAVVVVLTRQGFCNSTVAMATSNQSSVDFSATSSQSTTIVPSMTNSAPPMATTVPSMTTSVLSMSTSVPSMTASEPPMTTSEPLLTSGAQLSTTVGPPPTSSPTPTNPTCAAPHNANRIKSCIKDHPIITGLSAAVISLSILLLCMCYLWLCKKRRHVIYEFVEIEGKESEEEDEMIENPWTKTDDVDDNDGSSTGHNGTTNICEGNAHSRDQVTELKSTLAVKNTEHLVTVTDCDHQETSLVGNGVKPGDQQETPANKNSTTTAYEEIPSLDSMSIDWPDGLDHYTTPPSVSQTTAT